MTKRAACALTAALACLGAGVLTPTAASAATPTAPDPTHHLLTYAERDQNSGTTVTYGINVDDLDAGTTTTWVLPSTASGAAYVSSPVMSPDATKIAYLTDLATIHVLDLATDSDTVVASGENPTWAPDSATVVFDRPGATYGSNPSLYSVPATGGTATPISDGQDALAPELSPDGTRIAFIDDSDVTPSGGSPYLAVMSADGSNRHSLGVAGNRPAWSPDGTRLTYAEADPAAGSNSPTRVAVINADGTGHTQLASYPVGLTSDHTEDPVWSSDGTSIFFSEVPSTDPYDFDIFSLAADGTGLTDVKGGPLDDVTPSLTGPEPRPATAVAPPEAPSVTQDTASSVQVSWTAVAGATGYAVELEPGNVRQTVTGTTTSFTGLTRGATYSIRVASTNAVGTGLASAATSVTVPPTAPDAPAGATATAQGTTATVRWSPPYDGGAALSSYTVTASPGGAQQTVSANVSYALFSGLSNGVRYTFTVTATNRAGTSPSSAPSAAVAIDTTAPAVTVRTLPVVVTTSTSTVAYTATDATTGVASYDVRYRSATGTTGFTGYSIPSAFRARTATSASVSVLAGTTICWSVRARDHAGNVSAWTPDRCTVRAVDDRSLTVKTSGWTRITGSAFLNGTATKGRLTGAQLASPGWQRGRVRVVVTTCSTCGALRVYAGSTYLGTVSTYSATTRYRVVLSLSNVSAGGPIRLISTSSKQVLVDAVALLRY